MADNNRGYRSEVLHSADERNQVLQGRSVPPPKPWERAGTSAGSSGPSPFAPASNTNSTAAAVASSGTATSEAEKQEVARNAQNATGAAVGRPMPPRPWETNSTTAGYGTGGYGTGTMSYNRVGYGSTGYGGGMYGSSYGSSGYGSGMYGSSLGGMGGYGGGSMYGGGYGGSMYGGGMYGNRYGGGYGGMGGMGGMGYGMGGMGGYGMGGMPGDPNNPNGEPPPQAPGFWITMLHGLQGVMHFFGRLSILVDENTQAFHFFITALLQLCDRAGVLYGELARFVLRLLGFRTGAKARARSKAAARALEGGEMHPGHQQPGLEMITRHNAPEPAWDNVWPDSGPSS